MTKREKNKLMADRMKKAAIEYYNGQTKGERDETFLDMISADLADMKKIATLIRQNDLRKAANIAQGLDSFPRDCVPQSVWTYLEREGLDIPAGK